MNNTFGFEGIGSNDYNRLMNAVKIRAAQKKMSAAANYPNPQYNVGHNIILSMFEDTIYDYLNRRLSVFNLIPSYEANGPAHLWFEQGAIPDNTQYSDPRNLTYKAIGTDYQRLPKSAIVKCVTSKFSIPFFDTLAARQQNAMPDTVQKDLNDWLFAFDRFLNTKYIYGNDTSLETPTTLEHMGIMKQITNKPVRAKDATTKTITDVLETEVAKMDSNTTNVGPTEDGAFLVFLMNAQTMDLWIKEERVRNGNFHPYEDVFRPGFKIPYITTAKGKIPIVVENYLSITDNTANTSFDHPIVLVDRSKIETRYIGSPTPLVQPFNVYNDQLSDDRLAILFNTLIVRDAANSHFVLNYQVAK